MTTVSLSVDAMGGDFGPHVVIPACENFLRSHPDVSIVLFGSRESIEPLTGNKYFGERLKVEFASQIISVDDTPLIALRAKPDSSMRKALESVSSGRTSACVSAGNTGALMALSAHVIGRLKGVDRPAICTRIPTSCGATYLLDLGANVDCSAENLVQFAQMASTYVRAVERKDKPKIALLNIGEEQSKGNAQVKAAASLMSQFLDLNYVGFVEGNDLFTGDIDAIVCDGFVGNIALKTSEGVASFLFQSIREAARRSCVTRLVGAIAFYIFRHYFSRLDPRYLNGAIFLGINGIVVKSHGNADMLAFTRALEKAYQAVRFGVVRELADNFSASKRSADSGVQL